jgi:hypothetical protein
MNRFISVFILALYLLFNIGLSLNIHECANGKIDFNFFTFLKEDSNCYQKNCCHHEEKNDDQCNCEDLIFLLELSDEQISISSSFLEFDSNFISAYLTQPFKELLKSNYNEEHLTNPPPLIPTYKRVVSTQQLLFYA